MDNPKCPYCGAEMLPDYPTHCTYTCNGKYHARFECPKCRAQSPLGWADTQALAVDTAHAAAMRRWQKPNRVLTLDEIIALDPDDATCVESRRGEIEVQLNSDLRNEANAMVEDYGIDNARKLYGKHARAWLRRPTDEERAGAGWDK